MRAPLLAIFLAAAFLGGCDDDDGKTDAGPPDLAAPDLAVEDLSAPPDLTPEDGGCQFKIFPGFQPLWPTEQRFECPCGCYIDRFSGTTLAEFWAPNRVGRGSITPTTTGVLESASPAPGDPVSVAALASEAGIAPIFLDGDFDLSVTYRLNDALPPDAHALLRVDYPGGNDAYLVERVRNPDGTERYQAYLGGVGPLGVDTTATAGTLRLVRTGQTVEAWADGQKLGEFSPSTARRFDITLTMALTAEGCNQSGTPDGGVCSAGVVWRDLTLASGTLVDRR